MDRDRGREGGIGGCCKFEVAGKSRDVANR